MNTKRLALTKKSTALHEAVKIGNIDLLKKCANKRTVNKLDAEQLSALHVAVASDNYQIARLLLDRKATISRKTPEGKIALHLAFKNNNAPIIKLLLTRGADVNSYDNNGIAPFQENFNWLNDTILMKLVLDHGADVNRKDKHGHGLLHTVAVCYSYEALEIVLKANPLVNLSRDEDCQTVMHRLIDRCRMNEETLLLAKIRLLVSHGADVNAVDSFDFTPLFYAVNLGLSHTAKCLLELGADVNGSAEKNPFLAALAVNDIKMAKCLINNCDVNLLKLNNGDNALHIAISRVSNQESRHEVVKHLLEKGVNIDDVDSDGLSALHLAIQEHDLETFRVLLDKGARTNVKNRLGETPLFSAVFFDLNAFAELLIDVNSEVNDLDNENESILSKAVLNDNVQISKWLIDKGADVTHRSVILAIASLDEINLLKLLIESGTEISLIDHWIIETFFYKTTILTNLETVKYLVGEKIVCVDSVFSRSIALLNNISSINTREIVKFLIKHVALSSMIQKCHIDSDNVGLIKSVDWMLESYKLYYAELKIMKLKQIDENFCTTYFDILTKEGDLLMKALRSEEVCNVLERGDYKGIFTHYSTETQVNLLKGLQQKNLSDTYVTVLYSILGYVLPYDVIVNITKYLSKSDKANCIL